MTKLGVQNYQNVLVKNDIFFTLVKISLIKLFTYDSSRSADFLSSYNSDIENFASVGSSGTVIDSAQQMASLGVK